MGGILLACMWSGGIFAWVGVDVAGRGISGIGAADMGMSDMGRTDVDVAVMADMGIAGLALLTWV